MCVCVCVLGGCTVAVFWSPDKKTHCCALWLWISTGVFVSLFHFTNSDFMQVTGDELATIFTVFLWHLSSHFHEFDQQFLRFGKCWEDWSKLHTLLLSSVTHVNTFPYKWCDQDMWVEAKTRGANEGVGCWQQRKPFKVGWREILSVLKLHVKAVQRHVWQGWRFCVGLSDVCQIWKHHLRSRLPIQHKLNLLAAFIQLSKWNLL